MAFKLRQLNRQDLVAEERLYLNADQSKVVKEGDPEAASLLAGVGQVIPRFHVERLGLDKPQADADWQTPGPPTIPPAEAKARSTKVIKPETR